MNCEVNSKNQPEAVLLDTSLRTIQIESSFIEGNSIVFYDPKDLKHDFRRQNINCYNYFIDIKLNNITYDYVKKLYIQHYDLKELNDLPEGFIFPLEIYEKYSNIIDKERNEGLLYFCERSFLNWYKKNEEKSKYVYLTNKTDPSKRELKKLLTRYSNNYHDKVKKRMNWLMWTYGNENACSITLTLAPGSFRNDKLCMWETITVLLNEFMTELKAYLKKKGLPANRYIRCIEAMKGSVRTEFVGRGNPHIHICVFGIKWIPKSVINKFWPYGFNFINSTAKNQKVRYPIHYVTKYITKTYTENDPDNTLNQSLVWFFNKRSFDHSNKLVVPLNPKGSGSYDFSYFVVMDPLADDLTEMKAIFERESNFYTIPPPSIEGV